MFYGCSKFTFSCFNDEQPYDSTGTCQRVSFIKIKSCFTSMHYFLFQYMLRNDVV